ncbi:MAG: hypothetical protein LBI47_02675, partial [Puniceicoccales bacterium]|nr:hypothetical protein [Puniceicoccales bacterium]
PQPSTTPAAPSKPEADHPNATPLPGASAATPPPSSSRVLPSRPAVRPTTIQPLGNPGADKDLSATMRDNFLEAFKTKLPELVLDSDGLQTSKDIESLFQKNTTARHMSTFQYACSLQLFANDVLGLDDQGFEFLSVTPEDMQKLKNDMLEAFDRYTES